MLQPDVQEDLTTRNFRQHPAGPANFKRIASPAGCLECSRSDTQISGTGRKMSMSTPVDTRNAVSPPSAPSVPTNAHQNRHVLPGGDS
ncbi:hypothetical protein BaRGS_00036677, partial [Batillaria attramentaria]